MRFTALIIIPLLFSCSKNQEQSSKKIVSKQLVNDFYNKENIPFLIDLNNDGLSDIEITGNASISGSNGAKNELYIQGINGSSIFFQTKHDTSWFINVFDGSYDTVYNNNTFLQPTPYNLGDGINSQMNSSSELLTIYLKHDKGSINVPSSDISRADLIDGNFQYYCVNTPSGLHWLKIKPGIPITTLQSYSTFSASSNLTIVE